MTRDEHLFVCLAEECAEVAHVVGKILRFGANDHNPKTHDVANITLLNQELNDLIAVSSMLVDAGYKLDMDHNLQIKKRLKVEKYLKYSESVGKLNSTQSK